MQEDFSYELAVRCGAELELRGQSGAQRPFDGQTHLQISTRDCEKAVSTSATESESS
jgi:hypothetical protein